MLSFRCKFRQQLCFAFAKRVELTMACLPMIDFLFYYILVYPSHSVTVPKIFGLDDDAMLLFLTTFFFLSFIVLLTF